jgi:lipoprotein NlpD
VSRLAPLLPVLLVLVAPACRSRPDTLPDDLVEGAAPHGGVLHPVERGQTLWRIARAYGVTVQELAEVNDLGDPTQMKVGQALWVPRATRLLHVEPAPALGAKFEPPRASGKPAPPDDEPEPKVEVRRSRFIWPVNGVLFSRFGVRDGTQHDGIDISAPKGTGIVAADGGEVLYSGVQHGYGNIVLVKHADGLITIYAHNEENEVRAGERVKRGQTIARVGQTGRATGPHVHFEVREARIPRNPLFFLPESGRLSGGRDGP